MQSSRGLRGGSNECLYNTNLLMSTFASRSLVFSSTKSAVMTYLHDSQLSSTHGHLQLGPSVRHTEKHGQAGTRTKLCVGWVGLGGCCALCPGAELAFTITCDIGHVLQNPFHQLRRRQQTSALSQPSETTRCESFLWLHQALSRKLAGWCAEERRQQALRTVWRRRAPMFSTVVFTSAETAAATTPPNALLSAVGMLLLNAAKRTYLLECLLLKSQLHALRRHELCVPEQTADESTK